MFSSLGRAAPALFICALLLCLGCKSSKTDPPIDDGEGGEAGQGGAGGEATAGQGGQAGAGGTTVGGMAGQPIPVQCMGVVRDMPPAAIGGDDAPANVTLPLKIAFANASDLTGQFVVKGEASHVPDAGGAVKVAAGKRAVLVLDTTPDDEPTNVFEAFTAVVTFRSPRPMAMWLGFASDKGRNNAEVVRFAIDKEREGPAGISDVDALWFMKGCYLPDLGPEGKQSCFSMPLCAQPTAETFAWTHFAPSSSPQKFKLTVVPDKAAKTITAWAEFVDKNGVVVDGGRYVWTDVPHTTGELSLGMAPSALADAFIDELEIKAAEPIVDQGIVTLDDSSAHIWVPETLGTQPIKGLLITEPGLIRPPGAVGNAALFSHLRKFARAWGWALVGGLRTDRKDFETHFQSDMDKLVAKTGRQEINTVPVFIHSLLSIFPYQALSDATFNKRLIGFMMDKPRFGGDINAGTEETLELYPLSDDARKVPGFITYTSTVTSRFADRNAGAVSGIWSLNRFFPYLQDQSVQEISGALWTMTIHSMQTHAVVDSWALYLAFLQELIKTRTNNNDGKLPLKPVDTSAGFLGTSPFSKPAADNTAVMSKLEPFAGFPAPPSSVTKIFMEPQPDFVFGKSTALVWQAFDYYRQAVNATGPLLLEGGTLRFDPKKVWWIDSPAHGKAGDSRKLELGLDASLTGWKKIEFFDSASSTPMTPVATVMAGAAPEHTYASLSAGAHNFIAHVTSATDVVHATFPVMAVFEP